MKLSRSKKIALGILSIWPLVWMAIFIIIVFAIFVLGSAESNDFPTALIPAMVIHVLTCFSALGLMIYFIIHAASNIKLNQETKVVWILVLVIGYVIASPIYWYCNIWKEQTTVQ